MILCSFVGLCLCNYTLLDAYVLSVRPVDQLQRQGKWRTRAHSKWYYGKPGVVGFDEILELSINLSFFLMVKTFSQHHFCSSIKTRLLTLHLACRNNLQGCIFLEEINHWLSVFSLPTFISYLSSGLVEWSCAVVITTTPWRGWRSASTYVAKVGCPFWIYQTLPLNSKVGSDLQFKKYVLHYVIWHYLHNLKNEKNTHGRVLLLVKLQTNDTNGTKSHKASHIFKHVLYLSC